MTFYIYYVSASQGNGYQVSRVVTSTSSIENVTSLGNPASIARAGSNKLYVAAAGATALTEIDHTPAGSASLRSIPVNADGYQLSGILPLQPHTIAPEGGVQMIFGRKLDAKSYELKDHLGNVRAVVSDRKLSDLTGSAVPYTLTNFHPGLLAASNYYPFGMEMPGRNYNAPDYRYGFNGKEKDDEVTGSSGVTYDYGFRIYDARSARFLSADPLTKSYPMLTPYQYASNRPIDGIDLDGLEFSKKQTIDENTGNTLIHITVKVKVLNRQDVLSPEELKSYLQTAQDVFSNVTSVYDKDRKIKYTGSLVYDDNATILLGIRYPRPDDKSAGFAVPGMATNDIGDFKYNKKKGVEEFKLFSASEFGLIIAEEVLHQAGIYHPTDVDENKLLDVKLKMVGQKKDRTFETTETTDKKNIYFNLFLYDMAKIDGKKASDVRNGSTKRAVSPDQMDKVNQDIDKGKVNGEAMLDF